MFCCAVSVFFLMSLLECVSKAIMLLLTELVGQCRNILPSAFFCIELKGSGQYIPAMTFHPVNKS